ncbi:type III toxin-antitoxin system ToxN/AbiQ family toxin [Tepidibacter formicigenes]|jgi:protein AbiQ|uniref:Toxin ToxN, type III toxin-antitoxin system n=1 Tax=Tepidibacter formicigenes DSM 15518 TaxID=1123349 RepID=A0A1M6QJ06_9FIRM|nr:type III toxin-antitoxin system ToxN/AbiQ family toxin [Tepidibacter formicigenes]SHK20043.1 Toxin ToxN, type III toxin-antitoxin system [Tepidibacter formicigenes DSM 15518]
MSNINFYEVTEDYIDFLQKSEIQSRGFTRIPNIGYNTHEKFVCGIVLNINNLNYYAPVSSFKRQQKSNILIKDLRTNQILGSIRFSFMFPIPESELIYKDFSCEERRYARLLQKEYDFCNRYYSSILLKANRIYQMIINNYNPRFNNDCCDFRLLEKKSLEFEAIKQTKQEVAVTKE